MNIQHDLRCLTQAGKGFRADILLLIQPFYIVEYYRLSLLSGKVLNHRLGRQNKLIEYKEGSRGIISLTGP